MKKERDSNLELLRIIAMLGVVILHYNYEQVGGGFLHVAENSLNMWVLFGAESLFICAVNLFVLICGYFSCTNQRRPAVKVFALLLQVSLFRVGLYVLKSVLSGGFSLMGLIYSVLPVNYYVILYVVLYMVSPYINLALQRLSSKQLRRLLILSVILFSAWPTVVDMAEEITGQQIAGLSSIGLEGSQAGYTIVNFVLLYLVGAFLRLEKVSIRKRYAGMILLCCVLILPVWHYFLGGSAWAYCNPLVILEAAALFLLFKEIRFQSAFVNRLSAGAFTCFLLHAHFLPYCRVDWAVRQTAPVMLLHMVVVAIVIYLLCWCVYFVYSLAEKPMIAWADRFFKKHHVDFSLEDPA